jgi:hypothetical protein
LPSVLFWTAVASGAAGAAPPMISSTELEALLAIQTLPERSIAMEDSPRRLASLMIADAAPVLVKVLTEVAVELATQTVPAPSIAIAAGALRPFPL